MFKRTKGILIAVGTLFLFCASPARAAMVGGVAAPLKYGEASISLALGYSERDIKDGGEDAAASRRFLFKGAFGFGGGASVYAFAGLSDLDYRTTGGEHFKGKLAESVGAGLRYTPLGFSEDSRLVLDFQGDYLSSDDGDATVRATQFAFTTYVVGKFGTFYPYGGVSLSAAAYDGEGEDFKSSRNVGILLGTEYFVNPNVFLTLELRLFDENAAYLCAGYMF